MTEKTTPKNKMTWAKAFKEFIWPRRKTVLIGLGLIAISRAAGLILPLQSHVLLDEVIPNQDLPGLWTLLLLVVGASALQSVTSFIVTELLSV